MHLQGNLDEYNPPEFIINVSKPTVRYCNGKAGKLEKVAQHTDQCHVYRMLCQDKASPSYKSYLIKDTNDNKIQADCLNHWVKHFQQLPNQPPPQANKDFLSTTSMEINNTSYSLICLVTAAKVRAYKGTWKNCHAPGFCSITSKLKEKAPSCGQFTSSTRYGSMKNYLMIGEGGKILPFWKQHR